MSSIYNQIEKLKYTLDNENNTLNGPTWDLLVKYFECRDNDIIDKLLQMNEEKERKMRNETIFNTNRDKIPKLNFEKDNYEDWLYSVKACIRKTTYYNYFEKKDVIIEKNYENELYDIMEESIEENTKKQLQLDLTNKNPRKLLKEIVRTKQSIKSKQIKVLLGYINNHKYHKMEDIHQHLEIILMLFDELAKLKKVFSEQEKIEKILLSLPEDYANNIKKLTHNNQQLGLTILYIIKYVDIWNKKHSTGTGGKFYSSINEHDNPFLYSSQYLNSPTFTEAKLFEEPKETDDIKPTEKIDPQDPEEPVNNIKKEEIHEDSDDSKTLMHESSSDEESDVSIVNEKGIDSNFENKKEMENQNKLKKIFSLEHLFIYFILLLILEGLIFFKYDILKLFS